MKLEMSSLDNPNIRGRLNRAYVQIMAQREYHLYQIQREVEQGAGVYRRIMDMVKFRMDPEGQGGDIPVRRLPPIQRRRAARRRFTGFGAFGEIQGNSGRIDALIGAVRMCDEVLELLDDVLGREEA